MSPRKRQDRAEQEQREAGRAARCREALTPSRGRRDAGQSGGSVWDCRAVLENSARLQGRLWAKVIYPVTQSLPGNGLLLGGSSHRQRGRGWAPLARCPGCGRPSERHVLTGPTSGEAAVPAMIMWDPQALPETHHGRGMSTGTRGSLRRDGKGKWVLVSS